jgi:putative transcriptional regulator
VRARKKIPIPTARPRGRRLFDELMGGVAAMKEHREGRLTLRTHKVTPLAVPPVEPRLVLDLRNGFRMSRPVFARRIGVNPRTLERWEQGRSRPNDQAAVLIWLLRVFPDTLERLRQLPKAGERPGPYCG